jgi:hypothetical protein
MATKKKVSYYLLDEAYEDMGSGSFPSIDAAVKEAKEDANDRGMDDAIYHIGQVVAEVQVKFDTTATVKMLK